MSDPPRRLYLLDGHSLAFRAFYALPVSLATTAGQVTNAVYGFTSMLIKLLGEETPDLLAVSFDVGRPTVRLEKYAEYKAGRTEAPDEFRQQLGLIQEVLQTLRIPIVSIPGHEADDVIATLALRAHEEGMRVTIVTADRDFFQLLRPGIDMIYNLRGISETVRYDEAKVEERFGLPPSKYLDYVALKGDPSDNIPGIPGVGEKTASKLIQEFGSIEELVERVDEVKPPKLQEKVRAATDDLARNKDLARFVTDLELEVDPEDLAIREWDPEAVRRLFNSLEFRSLLERLEDLGRVAKPVVEAADLDLREAAPKELAKLLEGAAPRAVAVRGSLGHVEAVAISPGGGQAAHVALAKVPQELAAFAGDGSRPKWVHDAKELSTVLEAAGIRPGGVAFDTLLAAYLLDPAEAGYPLGPLCEQYLGVDVTQTEGAVSDGGDGQLFGHDWRPLAAEAAAVGLLAPVLAEKVERAGLKPLLEDVELPLAAVLARVQATGVAIDVEYLQEMSESLGDKMATLEAVIYEHAGEPFNLNSPPQLRIVLYEKLALSPGRKTSKGALSTDATVLEKLRDQHPIIEALLEYREISKLKSTYLDALPPLVDPRDGRVHTTYVQTSAATGRLSSVNPNLQNIPVRGDTGRQIRRAFVPGEAGQVFLVADYSQIELRVLAHLSGDEALHEAFASDTDIHTATAAKIAGLPQEHVDPEWRRRAKVVNYGLAYGMNAYGLAQRLGIAPDEAQEFIDAYFAGFPKVREFLDRQVGHATVEGFTATILGRRRYLPELQSPNPRVRDMGKRMALNAPIQGTAADIMKLSMIKVDAALEASGLPARMVMTVHDELVFEVDQAALGEASELVTREMEAAYLLEVPLRVEVGSGPNWAEAAPAGH
ncbi:MAG: DNA polymerase I [Actinomycetota bacterium]